jgi:FkbH-like protein
MQSGPHGLYWLPELTDDWRTSFQAIAASDQGSWADLMALSNARLDFILTSKLDKLLQRLCGDAPPPELATKPVRLAVLGSSTVDHLLPGLRVSALRRNIWLKAYVPDYGQYLSELLNADSKLREFAPNAFLCTFDPCHFVSMASMDLDQKAADALLQDGLERLKTIWHIAKNEFGALVIQQTFLQTFLPIIGNNEHRLPASQKRLIDRFNARLREMADEEGVNILALDDQAARDGVSAWHDPMLWHRAKQHISPAATPFYGELAGRLIAAMQGRSFKCLVLDLDNTLWGGVIGDDGIEGIVLGQGSALGEAYIAFQQYLLALSRRGVVLAVCSKNDEANALAPFHSHPEMILKREHIACFVANWQDKATNIREIAKRLNLGLDSFVFVDDNPFERNLVRRELPVVAVPEIPEDPALYATCLADAGYFEALDVTEEDRERTQQYQANWQREAIRTAHTDMEGYLRRLNMELRWAPFDKVGLKRIVQLINKTNQFNLTTRRCTEEEVLARMETPGSLTLQIRLVDQFGDNGIVAIVMGVPCKDSADILIDTWVMSCRVLGRKVEEATLNVIATEAARLRAGALIGEYRPTAKNGMVKDHYKKLGFQLFQARPNDESFWKMPLAAFKLFDVPINCVRA